MAHKNNSGGATLHDLFIHKLCSIHYVERELTKALPKMIKAANDPDLREAFTSHLRETEEHVARIEQALESAGEKVQKVEVAAIDGLIKDSEQMIKSAGSNEACDAALIASAQAVEHYEIALYGTAREWARIMGHDEAQDLLESTLEEEEAADAKLTDLALGGINERAHMEPAVM